jgi:hypothetical protein
MNLRDAEKLLVAKLRAGLHEQDDETIERLRRMGMEAEGETLFADMDGDELVALCDHAYAVRNPHQTDDAGRSALGVQ